MELEQRINEENRIKLERENQVAVMEQEELELIQKLQNTQILQKAGRLYIYIYIYIAYEDLETALSAQDSVPGSFVLGISPSTGKKGGKTPSSSNKKKKTPFKE